MSVPTGFADLNDTLFGCEVVSPMESGGAQAVRYGLTRENDGRERFRLDVDRFVEQAVNPDQIVDLLGAFAGDIFAVFVAAMGPDLKAWMPEK